MTRPRWLSIKNLCGSSSFCKVRDVGTGIVLAHTMADNMKVELVTETIRKAKRRWNLPKGCIHHSDLGAQYTAKEIRPVYHRLPERIESHVLLCWLAMLLIRVAENDYCSTPDCIFLIISPGKTIFVALPYKVLFFRMRNPF